MFEFFDQILGYIEMFFTFFTNMVRSLGMAFTLLTTSISFPMTLTEFMPPLIGSAVVVFVSIYVVKFIIGR